MTHTGVLGPAAHLYVRDAGPPALGRPRVHLGELPAGTYSAGLAAEGVSFELVADGADLSFEPLGADAAPLEAWVRALASLRCVPERVEVTTSVDPGDRFELRPGAVASTTTPLWIVADQPVLRTVGIGGAESRAADVLPCLDRLAVGCTTPATCRALGSADFLRELGPDGLARAAAGIAEAIAEWYRSSTDARRARDQATGRQDDRILRESFDQIGRVTSRHAARPMLDAARGPLHSVVELIGRREGFELSADEDPEPLDAPELRSRPRTAERLARMGARSNFRFREISLEGEWWREAGPSILLRRTQDGMPAAAIREHGAFHLLEPDGTVEPIRADVAARFDRRGYVLYPPLPHEISRRTIPRFALFGSGPDVVALLLAGLVAALLGLVVPIATGLIIGTAVPDGRTGLLAQMAVLAAAASVGTAAFTLARSLAMLRLSSRIDMRLQAALWDRVLRLPPRFFRGFTTGDLTHRVLAVDQVRRLLSSSVLGGLLGGVFAATSLILMLVYDLRLAAYGLAFAVLSIAFLAWFSWRQIRYLTVYRDSEGEVSSRIVGMLGGIAKLRLAAAEERAFARWSEPFVRQQRAAWHGGALRAGQLVANVVLPALGLLGVMLVAGLRADPIQLSVFAAFNTAFGQFIAALGGLSSALGSALQALPVARRAKPILEARPEVDASRLDPGPLDGHIAVRGLTFGYERGLDPVLRGLDLTIEPGEFLAVVGASGCGKSTLLRLLLGFEIPWSGAVFYGDRDLATLDLRRVRNQIGTVLQHAGVVPGSLFENVAGSAPLSDDEVMDAIRLAGLEEDVLKLPMGLQTFVSEDGGSFSGGQRQRIMIARALVRKPSILYFDEATSALDNRTQAIVSESLEKLEVTRLVIAHRLSTVRNADRIVVLSGGGIAESGRFEELMGLQGEFYRLAKRQLV